MSKAKVNTHVAGGLVVLLTGAFVLGLSTDAAIDTARYAGINYESWKGGLQIAGIVLEACGGIRTLYTAMVYGIGPEPK